VRVDFSSFTIVVEDNGWGMEESSLREIGNVRHSTTKDISKCTYGFRGEALHSIGMLSVVEIRTRVLGSRFTTSKMVFGGRTLSTIVDNSRNSPGTTVCVRDLFHEWPVRRLAMRRKVQLVRCKEVLQSLSMLNYRSHLTLVDAEANNVVWQVRPVNDLASRVRDVQGLPELQPVEKSCGPYRVHGLLSLLSKGPSKPLAMLYVNKRPLPSTSDLVDLLTSIGPEATTSMHAPTVRKAAIKAARPDAPHLRGQLIPTFILHIECPADECDVLLDPDKSNVFFRDPMELRCLLLEVLRDAACATPPDYAASQYARAVCAQLERSRPRVQVPLGASSGTSSTREHPTTSVHPPSSSSLPTTLSPAAPAPPLASFLHKASSSNDTLLSVPKVAPLLAGLPYASSYPAPTMSAPAQHPEGLPASSFQASLHHPEQVSAESEGHQTEDRQIFPGTSNEGGSVQSSPGNFSDAFFGALRSPEEECILRMSLQVCSTVQRDDPKSQDPNSVESDNRRFSFSSAFFSNSSIRSSLGDAKPFKPDANLLEARNLEEDLRNDDTNHENDQENPHDVHSEGIEEMVPMDFENLDTGEVSDLREIEEISVPSAALPLDVDHVDDLDNGRFRAPKMVAPERSILNLAFTSKERAAPPELTRVTKDMIRNTTTIAQTASKFVLARSGSMLLCFDQHAADERVQLEMLEKQVYGDLSSGIHANQVILAPPESTALSGHELALLSLYGEALKLYGFDFTVPAEAASSSSAAPILVRAAPVVLGVQLSGEDMLSILHQLSEYDPSGVGLQVKPAVVQYVLCSKACRSAIMFGDRLDPTECAALISKLGQCDHPFSCAHGRPSSVVLANDLRAITSLLSEKRTSRSKRAGSDQKLRGNPTKKLRLKELIDVPLASAT